MSIALSVLASAMAVPAIEPKTARRIQAFYPQKSLDDGKSGGAYVEITAAPDGNIISCRSMRKEGDEFLAELPCRVLPQVKTLPARDSSGKPAFGVRRFVVSWMVNPNPRDNVNTRLKSLPDFELSVAKLESKAKSIDVTILFAVNVNGVVGQCEGTPESSQAYAKVACREAMKLPQPVRLDENKQPFPYIDSLLVRFVAAGAP